MTDFRSLPSVDRLLGQLPDAVQEHGRASVVDAVRTELALLRERIRAGQGTARDADSIAASVHSRLQAQRRSSLRPVLNLTGTLVHTNLGRAVLPPSARAAVAAVASEACNLEYDLGAGQRGDRDSHVEGLLCELTGAQAATVVNNNAAAVLLVLNTLALGREVPVSRGELIEIGDAFRIPDIISRSGAKLVEVGTTNRTHPRDFENAITADTAALMQVHTSNYVVQGFTSAVPLVEMSAIAHRHGVPMLSDLGSGTLVDLGDYSLPREVTVAEVLNADVDIVTFSGDKLLGGPQAGLIVGSADLMQQIKRNPLRRALRIDKLRIAALAEVLALHRDPQKLAQELPTMRMMLRPLDDLRRVAEALIAGLTPHLPDWVVLEIADNTAQPGSGSLPGKEIPSLALRFASMPRKDAAARHLEKVFRSLSLPVIGRIRDSAFQLDLRNLEQPDVLLALGSELASGLATPMEAST